ncbi:hypothetical protein Tco_0002093 [Tanacetum coccineum]
MSVKYPNYVNLTSSSEEQPNERTPSPPPRKKSLSPPQVPLKSISSKSTHYTSSSSLKLPPLQISPNVPYAQTMDNWPLGPSNPSPPPRVSRPPPGFPNPTINPTISRMLLYIQGKEHGIQLFDSVKNGPFKFGIVKVPTPPNTPASTRDGTLDDLTSEEKILAKEIWDRAKLLIQGVVVPKFLPTDDPIKSLNKAMTFLSTAITSRYPQTNNKLGTLSNPKNQATIQDGQIDDIDAFDSDCDEMPTTSLVFMANLYAYDSDVLSKVLNQDTYQDNNVIGDQSVQEMKYFEQLVFVYDLNIDITSDSNAISYDQYMKENKSEVVQDTTSSEQQDAMMMSVIEEMSNQVAKRNVVNKEDKYVNESLTIELKRYKEHVKNFEERQKFELTDREKHIDS